MVELQRQGCRHKNLAREGSMPLAEEPEGRGRWSRKEGPGPEFIMQLDRYNNPRPWYSHSDYEEQRSVPIGWDMDPLCVIRQWDRAAES